MTHAADHSEIVHKPRQCRYCNVYEILLWSAEYTLNQITENFDWIPNSIEIPLVARAPALQPVSQIVHKWK